MLELCSIRSVTHDDLPMLFSWRNHPDVRRFMFTQHEISPHEHLNWYAKSCQDPSRRLLIVQEQQIPFGFVQFDHLSTGAVCDWGFYTAPQAPKGSGKKLGYVALNHAFSSLQLHKVCGQAIVSNKASQGLHQSLGFQQEGLLRDQHHVDGIYQSVICYGLLAHEWHAQSTDKENTHAPH